MPMRIMHRLSMKLSAMIPRMFPARWHRPMVPMPIVIMVINMPIEVIRPMEPRPSPNKNPACKPLRTVITIRCAIVRRYLVVPIWTNRGSPDLHRNLRRSNMIRCEKQPGRHSSEPKILQLVRNLSSVHGNTSLNQTDRYPHELQSTFSTDQAGS